MASNALTRALFRTNQPLTLIRQARAFNSPSSSPFRQHYFFTAILNRPATTGPHALHNNRPLTTAPIRPLTTAALNRPCLDRPLKVRRAISTIPRTATTTTLPPPIFHPRPWYRRRRYVVPLFLIGVPLLFVTVGPGVFIPVIIGSAVLLVSVVFLATGALFLGIAVPVALIAAGTLVTVPASEFYFRARDLAETGFEPREWEIVDAEEDKDLNGFSVRFGGGTGVEKKEGDDVREDSPVDIVFTHGKGGEATSGKVSVDGMAERWFRERYLAVGRVVEEECMRREKAGQPPLPDRVVIRSKKRWVWKVRIPVDRQWVRSEMEKGSPNGFERVKVLE